MKRTLSLWAIGLLIALIGCQPTPAAITADEPANSVDTLPSLAPTEPTPAPTRTPSPTAESTPAPPTPIPTVGPTPTYPFSLSPSCGQTLPLLADPADSPTFDHWIVPPLTDEVIPADVIPALEQFFEHPESVSLVVYQVGYEGIGFYHNADQPMPLASVSKIIILAAYAEAVALGELDPNERVPLEALEAYYLPRSDLNSHTNALRELDSDHLTLDDIAWMMMRYSANSAADYLHLRLGQARIEATTQSIGLTSHTALCPYLGRFLFMGATSTADVSTYQSDPSLYGDAVSLLTDRYVLDPSYRQSAEGSWQRGRQPSFDKQKTFVDLFDAHGTAEEYALVLGRLSTNTLGQAGIQTETKMRELMGWPLDEFELNQERYSEIGYKNGTLPGVLTTIYFAQPYWSDTPVVVALFFKDLPDSTYRSWRRTLPHDAMAHWLMSNPSGIHNMHILRDSATPAP